MVNYEDWNKLLNYRDEVRNRTLWNKYAIDFGCEVDTIDDKYGVKLYPRFGFWLKDKDGNKFGSVYTLIWKYDTLRDDWGDSIVTYINKTIDSMCNHFILGQGEKW